MDKNNNIEKLLENLSAQAMFDADAGWENVLKRIKRNRNSIRFFHIIRNSAAVLLPLFLVFQYIIYPQIKQSEEQLMTLSAAPGMVINATLPDGSEVWLNSQSSISYPQVFGKRERRVELSGEAYFKVHSDRKHRFNVIIPNGVTVSAYGTEFNVNAYASDQTAEVTLASGNLELLSESISEDANQLFVNEKAIINNRNLQIETFATDTYVDTAWKDGKMVFRRTKLDKIAERLSRKFGVDFVLEDQKLNEYEYTATFVDETLEDILELLKMSAPITYKIDPPKQLDNKTYTQRKIIIRIKKE